MQRDAGKDQPQAEAGENGRQADQHEPVLAQGIPGQVRKAQAARQTGSGRSGDRGHLAAFFGQAARRRIKITVAAISSSDSAISQPNSMNWNV